MANILVSELLALKIENSQLKLEHLQRTATELLKEQQVLIAQAREETQADPQALYNTTTRMFEAPPTPNEPNA